MGEIRNILYVMYDQLRWDYLSCAGHPWLETPNFDRLAARGLRFTRAYCQAPICGASRMSAYTGRYCHSHGASWNGFPLRVGEHTLGDHMRALGWGCHLIGKTHMTPDERGMKRLGIDPGSEVGRRIIECGFDAWIRDDGLWAEGPDGFYDTRPSPYNAYLAAKGYPPHNPWHDFANSGRTDEGLLAGGFYMQWADLPANIREEDTETPWLTDRAIEFIEAQGEARWLAHVSYIKPHWPYVAAEPYNSMFGPEHVLPPVRHERELEEAHPVMRAFMEGTVGRTWSRDEVRARVIPVYMGLIRQCDDHFGRLIEHLERTGRMAHTMIVLTSDHGDYLGDHWMGEKNLFHDPSVKVPLIVVDSRPEADATRGQSCDEPVELIDLVSTFYAAAGGQPEDIGHIAEGRDLTPLLHGGALEGERDYAISEYDYSALPFAARLVPRPRDARLMMVATRRWKFVNAEGGLRPQLFDLENDPDELVDRALDPACRPVIDEMYDRLNAWARRLSQRTALSDAEIAASRGASRRKGVLIGMWDGSEYDEELQVAYRPRPVPDMRD